MSRNSDFNIFYKRYTGLDGLERCPRHILCLVAIVQLFHLVENQIILSESDITKIAQLRTLYLKQSNKIEKLWIDYNADRMDEGQVSNAFFKLREFVSISALSTNLLRFLILSLLSNSSIFTAFLYLRTYCPYRLNIQPWSWERRKC